LVMDVTNVFKVVLFLCSMAKFQNLIKFNEVLGPLASLIVTSLIKVLPVLFIFTMWTLYFQMVYYVLGVYDD